MSVTPKSFYRDNIAAESFFFAFLSRGKYFIPYSNDAERQGAVTLVSHEVVSECFILNGKLDISSEINSFIYGEDNEFRISPQLIGDIK